MNASPYLAHAEERNAGAGGLAASFPVVLLGRSAAKALRTQADWEVCAVFRRSFYCRARDGSIVCLGPLGLGAGPLNVLCLVPEAMGWDAGLLSPGDLARDDGSTLSVADRYTFSLLSAQVWRPSGLVGRCAPAVLGEGMEELGAAASRFPVRGGLHGLVPGLALPSRWEAVPATPLLRMALPGIARLRRWLTESLAGSPRRVESPFPEAESLVGLGPGLTPSGDDSLGGMLVALHTFGYAILADRLSAETLPRARQRTNAISYAHLASAASGEGAAALHDTLETLARPGAPGLADCLRTIDAIGHSSGWDALAGATLVMAAIAGLGLK